MVQLQPAQRLDATFAALADGTRRGVLARLGRADASIGDLATGFGMSLSGMKKHVAVLEKVGLVATEKRGRVRHCRLGGADLGEVTTWLDAYRRLWEARFASLDQLLATLQHEEISHGHRSPGHAAD